MNFLMSLCLLLFQVSEMDDMEHQQKEVLEEMNRQIFLLRSKLARYEALCHEKEERTVLQQTANDLIPNAAEAKTNCVDATIQLGGCSKKLTFCKRAIFQTFWRLHCCAKFSFFELETSNFGYLLIF